MPPGHRWAGACVAVAAVLSLAACGRNDAQSADADAARAGAALDHAASDANKAVDSLAAKARPAADRAAHDARRGLDKLALATGRAEMKAGAALEQAGRSVARHGEPSNAGD